MTVKNVEEKKLVGVEVSDNQSGVNIFLTFLPHEYQHIHINHDESVDFWLTEKGTWTMVKGKKTTKL